MTDLSVVVPTLNEAENIAPLIDAISAALAGRSHEIIVVDDNSSDGTGRIVADLSKSKPSVKLVSRTEKNGLSAAVLDGFRQAQGRFVAVMDADFSHDPALLPRLLEEAEKGPEIVVGSRRVKGGGADHWPLYRRFLSAFATKLSVCWLGVPLSDPMSGFFVVSRERVEKMLPELNPRGYKILLEIVVRGVMKDIREIPFIFKDRRQGHSKLSTRVMSQYALMLWDLRPYSRPFHALRYTYHTGRYRKVVANLGEGSVLDIGCGRPCETMPDEAFLRYLGRPGSVGLDIKDVTGPYQFVKGSITAMPFPDEHFDNIVAMEVLEHINDVDVALKELKRVLKTGGTLVISTPDCHPVWDAIWHKWTHLVGQMWHDAHVMNLRADGWRKLIETQFTVTRFFRHWFFDLVFVCKK